MYLYQPCLLTLVLLTWANEPSRRSRYLKMLSLAAVLALSEVELTFTYVSLYPAALLLPLLWIVARARSIVWPEVLTAAFLGGLVSWKAADLLPLFPGLTPLCGLLMLIPIRCLCRDRMDRLLACAVGSLFFELFFCLREYMLFTFCVLRLGSRDALSLNSASLCLYALLEKTLRLALPRLKRAFAR